MFDPTLPITDVDAKVNWLVAAGYTFGLFGKLGLVTAALPYAWGDITGQVAEVDCSIPRSGSSDARLKLSVNLLGNPAMRAREFAKAPRRTILGTSLTVSAPSGQYHGTKLINLGTNRWAFKPEIGVAVPKGRWDFDADLGVWLFTHNTNFYPGGLERSQDPVVSLQGHVSYTFRRRLWAAIDATWYNGGSAQVQGGTPGASMDNARLGATLSIPAGRSQSFKLAYSSGVVVRTGDEFPKPQRGLAVAVAHEEVGKTSPGALCDNSRVAGVRPGRAKRVAPRQGSGRTRARSRVRRVRWPRG